MQNILIWVGLSVFFALAFMAEIIFLIIISKKTHAIIEFKSSMKRTPIGLFFQDNGYCEWKNTKPDAGLIEDDVYGTFIIDSTYIDKKTKNVLVPFNSNFAVSLNAKAVKLADDLAYVYKEHDKRKTLKHKILNSDIKETDGVNTLRTSINFTTIKNFVSPIMPQNIKSKIASEVKLRLRNTSKVNVQNVILLVVSALGALVLGGLVLKFMVF